MTRKQIKILVLFIALLFSNNYNITKAENASVLNSICNSDIILIGSVIKYQNLSEHRDVYSIFIDTILKNKLSYHEKEIIIGSSYRSIGFRSINTIYGSKLLFIDYSEQFDNYKLHLSFDIQLYSFESVLNKKIKNLELGELTKLEETFYGIEYDERVLKILEIDIPKSLVIEVKNYDGKSKTKKIIPVNYLLNYCNEKR